MNTRTMQRLLLTMAGVTFAVAGFNYSTGSSIPLASANHWGDGGDAYAAASLPPAAAPKASLPPAASGVRAATKPQPFAPGFPFQGDVFTGFVSDSYHQPGAAAGGADVFYYWMEGAYARTHRRVGTPPGVAATLPLTQALDAEKAHLATISDPARKTLAEEQVAAWAHKTVKKAIPHFSLARGYEFYNMTQRGERQCLAQSVLIAGMLQRSGIPAGVVMVWKSNKGQTSNNGHCVAVMQLANGRHILVDASDRTPFPRQQGLFVAEGGLYQYVTPVYSRGTGPAEIIAYRNQGGGEQVPVNVVGTMDIAFIRSQFVYYRGERTPGGPFSRHTTPAGLAASAQHLQEAIRNCPQNPLAVYMLGRVYQKMGRTDLARTQFAMAHSQYDRFGYVPAGAEDAYIRSNAGIVQLSSAAPDRLP